MNLIEIQCYETKVTFTKYLNPRRKVEKLPYLTEIDLDHVSAIEYKDVKEIEWEEWEAEERYLLFFKKTFRHEKEIKTMRKMYDILCDGAWFRVAELPKELQSCLNNS